jgi:hypothetical protein
LHDSARVRTCGTNTLPFEAHASSALRRQVARRSASST